MDKDSYDAMDTSERWAFDQQVAEWTAKTRIVDVGDNVGGCHVYAMVDSDDNVLWGYCQDHGIQPATRGDDNDPDSAIALSMLFVMLGKLPQPSIAHHIFEAWISAQKQAVAQSAIAQPIFDSIVNPN